MYPHTDTAADDTHFLVAFDILFRTMIMIMYCSRQVSVADEEQPSTGLADHERFRGQIAVNTKSVRRYDNSGHRGDYAAIGRF